MNAGMYGIGQAADAFSDDPEAYAAVQNDQTKRMIAQMLLARGMQQPQGQMVGRFYVPPSALQHISGLAHAGTGTFLMGHADQKRAELAKQIQDRQKKEVEAFQQSISPQQVEVPAQGPGAPVATPQGQEVAEHVNAGLVPTGTPLSSEFMERREPLFTEGPQPTTTTNVPRGKEEVQKAYMQALMGTNPRLREAAKFMAQQQQAEEQKGLDRELKREGIDANVMTRLEQMKNTAALTAMQIDARDRAGQDATDLKKALADQTMEIKKLEMGSRERMASAHDQTLKEIAGMKGGGKEEKAQEAKEAGYQQVQELTAQLKSYHDELRAGGGETDTEKGALENLKASVSGSSVGQMVGKAFGTKNQEARNKVAMTRPILMASIMKATGMSAKSLDSNVELKLWLSTATDPDMGYQANMQALENIQKFVEKTRGGGIQSQGAAPSLPAESSGKIIDFKDLK
jgi:hypothetical protein